MKIIKKLSALFLVVVMLFSLAGCSNDSAELVGTWHCKMDILDMLVEQFEADPSTADFVDHVEMEEFVIEMVLVFNADGTYTMTIDKESYIDNLNKMVSECVTGYLYDYFASYFESEGLSGTVDEILAGLGMNMTDLVAESLSEMDLSDMSNAFDQSGNYTASNGKIYRSDGVENLPDPEVYETYTLEGNTLTIHNYFNHGESNSVGYPMVFERTA